MSYGVRLTDIDGQKLELTSKCASIIASGTANLSNSLNADDTYGVDINLNSSSAISESNLGVIINPSQDIVYSVLNRRFEYSSILYASSQYMNSASTYYTRNDTTGVMTAWTAGNLTNGDRNTWDSVLAVFPIAFWDKLGATSFTSIRLFSAMCYLVYDTSASSKIIVYSIGSAGISSIEYVIIQNGK
jgi:hypothetical protein